MAIGFIVESGISQTMCSYACSCFSTDFDARDRRSLCSPETFHTPNFRDSSGKYEFLHVHFVISSAKSNPEFRILAIIQEGNSFVKSHTFSMGCPYRCHVVYSLRCISDCRGKVISSAAVQATRPDCPWSWLYLPGSPFAASHPVVLYLDKRYRRSRPISILANLRLPCLQNL
jgi:hypothetical protein